MASSAISSENLRGGGGGLLRARRKALGLTQVDVALKAHASISYVRLLESGFEPTTSRGEVFARVVEVLFTDHNDDDPAQPGEVVKEASTSGPRRQD